MLPLALSSSKFQVELTLAAALAGKIPVAIYDDLLKVLSLFSVIGPAGVSGLEATGYDTNDPMNTYDDALQRIKVIYDQGNCPLVSNALFLPNRILVKMG